MLPFGYETYEDRAMSHLMRLPESRDALPMLDQRDAVGLDTEFMREKTYYAELCLIQVAAGETLLGIDPKQDDDQSAFWQRLGELDWVVHSARQDLEVIYQTTGVLPKELFDTQIAAGLIGLQPQLGYAALVKELFDAELPKTHTRANWARRPLPDELLDYAAEDVEYLLPAADALAEKLDARGRLDWARADSALLLDRALYEPDVDNAIDRVKGARNLHGRRRSAAALLAGWREERAIQRNKPRQWILRDNVLMEIATRLPDSTRALAAIPDMPARFADRNGGAILDLVEQSAAEESDYRPPGAPDEAQKALLKRMQAIVARVARELGLANEVVASRKELSAVIVSNDRTSRVFRDWRRELVGDELLALL